MALFNVLFDIAARTANIESAFTKIERRLDNMGGLAKKAGAAIGTYLSYEVFKSGIEGAIDYGSEISKAAARTGVATEQISAMAYATKQLGDVELPVLVDSINKMQDRLQNGTPKAMKAFSQLGIEVKAFKQLNAEEQFKLIADRISAVADPARRANIAMQIFSEAGAKLLPVLNQGSEALNAYIVEAEKFGLALDQYQIQKLGEAEEAVKRLQGAWQGFWNNVAVGAVKTAEVLGVLDKPEYEKNTKELNKLLSQRAGILQQISDLEQNTKGRTQGETENALRVQQANLEKVEAKIQTVNEALLKLDGTVQQGTSDTIDAVTANGLLSYSLSEVTVTADRAKSTYEIMIDKQIDLYKSTTAAYQSMNDQRNSFAEGWQDLANNGLSGFQMPELPQIDAQSQDENYRNLLSSLGIYVENVKLSYADMYAAIDQQRQLHNISEQQAADARIALAKMERDSRIEAMSTLFGGLAQLTSSGNRRMFEIGKAAAIANATVAAGQAIMNAYATSPWYVGLAQGVAAAATLYSQIEQIKSYSFKGYMSGGYTGDLGTNQVAGVVHGQEYVFDAASTARIGRGNLDALRSGQSGWGGNIVIENHGTQQSYSRAPGLTPDEVRLIARDVVRADTPSLVSSHVANANSSISKSLSRNTETRRRR